MIRAKFPSVALLTAFALSLTALAADTNNLDGKQSKVTITFKQEGVPVDANFTKFAGRIVYDAKAPAQASANIDVETASFDLGDPAYNTETRGKEWLDSATYPKANFRSTAIKALAADKFEATGTLTLKGKVQTITVPITAKSSATGTAFDGTFVISRKAFGIGSAAWDSVLDDKVSIRFHLVSSGR